MRCHRCGHPMLLEYTRKYPYQRTGKPRPVWRCSNKLFCTEERWAHPDGTPMSLPADEETKQARIVAHVAFDNLVRVKRLSRGQGYRWMQKSMNLTKDEAHIGHFDRDRCLKFVELVSKELEPDEPVQ